MIIMGLGRPVKVEPLSGALVNVGFLCLIVVIFVEAMAVELGSDMLSEMFIFVIGATILIYEYNRSAESAERKEKEMQVLVLSLFLLQFCSIAESSSNNGTQDRGAGHCVRATESTD